jgi:3-methyladenine DNA glycosylase/8-oxoguanine DNA glycosylase
MLPGVHTCSCPRVELVSAVLDRWGSWSGFAAFVLFCLGFPRAGVTVLLA